MNSLDKQVLIIEDHDESMDKICQLMDKFEDVVILKAQNSDIAYRYAMEYSIDLFIVDIILKTTEYADISGLKFIEAIRTVDRYKFTPVIVTTSLEDPKFHAYAHLHCFRYFEKPYDEEELEESIRSALEFRTIKKAKNFYSYKDDGIIYSVKIKNIVYFRTLDRIIFLLHVSYKR